MGGFARAVIGVAAVAVGIATGQPWLITAGRSLFWSTVIGTVSRALTKKPSNGATMAAQGRMETVRAPLGPWQVIYGRCRVGGNLTFFETTTDNQTALMIVTLAGHPVQNIRDVYFNDVSTKDYASAGAVGNATGRFSGYSTVTRSDGTEGASQPFTALAARGLSWTSAHLQRDRAKVHTTHTFNNDVWSTGLPQVSAVINGVKDIYDPRLGSPTTNRWSNNPALCLAHYLCASTGLDADYATEIDEASLIAAANICDERVTLSGNRTATVASLSDGNDWVELATGQPHADWGDGVRFATSSPGSLGGGLSEGVTYYVIPAFEGDKITGQTILLATSYANAMAGISIGISSAASSGTVTMTYYDEPRFRLNGAFALTEKPMAIIERMLMAMAGRLVNTGGVWYVYAGAYITPTLTFDEDDLAGPIEIQTNLSRRENANRVKGTFVDPSNGYQPVDFPPITSSTYLAEDGGNPVFRDIDLTAFVTSGTQAQRLAKIDLIASRLGLTVRTRFKLSGFQMITGGTILLDNTQMGWSAKPFEVLNCTLVFEQDGRIEVDAVLRETDSAIYDWSTSEEQLATLAPNTNLPDPTVVSAPTALTFAQSTTVPNRADLSWTAPTDAFVDTYQLEWADSGSPTVWNPMPPTRDTALSIDGLDLGAYEFRVKAVNIFNAASDYATTTGSMTAPDVADVTGLVIYGTSGSPTVTEFTGKDCTVQWDSVASGTAGYFFKDYEVSVYRAGSPTTLLRTEYTANPWYTYTFEKNYKDTNGTPVRAFRFEVKRRGFYNQVSDVAALLEVSNSAPTVSDFTATAITSGAVFNYTQPSDPDWAGIEIYASTTTGFTPAADNLLYKGLSAEIERRNLAGGIALYYQYRLFDAFGASSYSAQGGVIPLNETFAYYGVGDAAGMTALRAYIDGQAGTTVPKCALYCPANDRVYIGSQGYLVIVNPATDSVEKVITSATLGDMYRAVFNPVDGYIYCTVGSGAPGSAGDNARLITVVNPQDDSVVATHTVTGIDNAIAAMTYCSSDGNIYISDYNFGSPTTLKVAVWSPNGSPIGTIRTITMAQQPLGVEANAYCPSNDRVYIARYLAVDVINPSTGAIAASITFVSEVISIAYIPSIDRVAVMQGGLISFVNPATNTVASTFTPSGCVSMVYSRENDRIYALTDSGFVYTIVPATLVGPLRSISGVSEFLVSAYAPKQRKIVTAGRNSGGTMKVAILST